MNPYTATVTRRVAYDAPYGGEVTSELFPVFKAWGLATEALQLPAPAFNHLADNQIEAAIALHLFAGVEPEHTSLNVHWVEFIDIPVPDFASKLFRDALEFDQYDPETDHVCALVHKATRQVLCYYAFVQGHGTAVFFSL